MLEQGSARTPKSGTASAWWLTATLRCLFGGYELSFGASSGI
jgi:hypothetical protein